MNLDIFKDMYQYFWEFLYKVLDVFGIKLGE